MFYRIAYYMIKLVSICFFPLRVTGRENIPARGAFILASNHISNIDPFAIGLAAYRTISYMAKDTLFKNRVAAFFLSLVQAYPIRRESSDIRSLRETFRRLKSGMPVLVFPQGSRETVRGAGKVYTGVGFLAVKTGAPVIPVFISNSDKVLPPKARFFRRGLVHIRFGAPCSFSADEDYDTAANVIMSEVQKLAAE